MHGSVVQLLNRGKLLKVIVEKWQYSEGENRKIEKQQKDEDLIHTLQKVSHTLFFGTNFAIFFLLTIPLLNKLLFSPREPQEVLLYLGGVTWKELC